MDIKELEEYDMIRDLLHELKRRTGYTELIIGRDSKVVAHYNGGLIFDKPCCLKVGNVCKLREIDCVDGPKPPIKIKITKIVLPPEEYPQKIMYVEYEEIKEPPTEETPE